MVFRLYSCCVTIRFSPTSQTLYGDVITSTMRYAYDSTSMTVTASQFSDVFEGMRCVLSRIRALSNKLFDRRRRQCYKCVMITPFNRDLDV